MELIVCTYFFQTQPPIDLLSILQNSQKNHRLVLTVPWMVHQLSMMSYTCLRLTYYKNLAYHLFQIYANAICIPVQTTVKNISKTDLLESVNISLNTRILLRICLGWLFDMPQFPQEFFYSWLKGYRLTLSQIYIKDIRSGRINDSSEVSLEQVVSKLNTDVKDSKSEPVKVVSGDKLNLNEELMRFSIRDSKAGSTLDRLELVDGNLILAVCPFLKELKTLLSSNRDASGGEKNKTFRHITPLTSSFNDDNSKHREKQIQVRTLFYFYFTKM